MPRKTGVDDLPSLRFRYPAALHSQVLEVLEALETAEDATRHRGALSDVVLELTEAGLDWYFVKAVQDAKVGYVAEQSTKLGLPSIRKVMDPGHPAGHRRDEPRPVAVGRRAHPDTHGVNRRHGGACAGRP